MDNINNTCQGCVNTLQKFLTITDSEILNFLQDHGVVENAHKCPSCEEPCKLSADKSWRCNRVRIVRKSKKKKIVRCSFKLSLRIGTIFERSRFSITQITNFIALALLPDSPTQSFLESELGWAHQSILDWHSIYREVLVDWAVENSDGMLGGKGKFVEIDETTVGKRKYDRGRLVEGQCLLAGIERKSNKMFILPLENRKKETLIKIIQEHILPGTTIITDFWKSYNELYQENCKHLAVTPSMKFVDPQTRAHTKNFEYSWWGFKTEIPKCDQKEENFPGCLAEFAFRHKYPVHTNRLHEYFLAVAKFNNPRITNNN